MKNENIKILSVAIILIVIIVTAIVLIGKTLSNKKDFTIDIGEENKDDFTEIYRISNDKKVYTSIKDIEYRQGDKEISLEKALKNKTITLENLFAKSEFRDALNDGGTSIYFFKKGSFTNRDFVVVDC